MGKGIAVDTLHEGIRLEKEIERGDAVTIFVDGRPVKAYKGETIAAALIADGHWVCQTHNSRSMGVFCNIGICYGCVMTVNGKTGVKTCSTMVSDGCRIETRRIERRASAE